MRRPLLSSVSVLLVSVLVVAGCAEEVAGSPLSVRVPAVPEATAEPTDPEPADSEGGMLVFDEFALVNDEGQYEVATPEPR